MDKKDKDKVKRVLLGQVISNRCDKTITVKIQRRVRHRFYKKIIERSTKIHAHDENNSAQLGDTVWVEATKPFSKTKHWRLLEVVEKAVKVD